MNKAWHESKQSTGRVIFFYSSLGFCIMKSHRSALGSEGYIVNVQRFELRKKKSYQISHLYCTKHFWNKKYMDTIKYLNPHLFPAGGTGQLYSPARRRSLRTLISLSSAGVRIWQMQTMSDSLMARTHSGVGGL